MQHRIASMTLIKSTYHPNKDVNMHKTKQKTPQKVKSHKNVSISRSMNGFLLPVQVHAASRTLRWFL